MSIRLDAVPERIANADILAYESLVAFRDSHPVRFDRNHPFFGQLLTDPTLCTRSRYAGWITNSVSIITRLTWGEFSSVITC